MEARAAEPTPLIEEQWPQFAPPKEAYLYFPTVQEQYKGKEKKILRYFFEGDIKYDEYEYMRLERLHKHLAEKKQTDVAIGWSEPDLLRWINGSQFESGKARKAMIQHNEWKKQFPLKFDDEVKRFLTSGFIYMTGRDHRFRPIIVMNISRISPKEANAEYILKGIDYFLNTILTFGMLPGQIESWVFIMDFNNSGISDLPISLFKKIITYMSDNYKFHLYRLFVVNCTKAITVPWGVIKIILEEDTVMKINFVNGPVPEGLQQLANPSQYEERFGGKQVNRDANFKDYWPPSFPQSDFFISTDKPSEFLMDVQKYQNLEREGKLKKFKVCQELLQAGVQISFENMTLTASNGGNANKQEEEKREQ